MPLKGLAGSLQADKVLLALLIGSLAANVYLGGHRATSLSRERPSLISTGMHAPALEGIDESGRQVRIAFGGSRSTLFYVFSPTCHWCERNRDNIRAIIHSRKDLRVIGINIGPPARTSVTDAQPFSEIVRPSSASARAFGFTGTPTTILISGDGIVLNSWIGAYDGHTAQEVSQVLAVALPGLRAE